MSLSSAPAARPALPAIAVPRRASPAAPAQRALSWRAIGVGLVFSTLLLTVLTLGGLALRPRLADGLAFAEVPPFVPLPAIEAPVAPPAPLAPKGFAGGVNLAPKPAPLPQQLAQVIVKEDPLLKPGPVGEVGTNTCGTSVQFVSNPRQAARLAKQDDRLLFTLHISGEFEDPGFT